MRKKYQVVLKIDEFFPVSLANLITSLELCRDDLRSVVLWPQNEIAARFQKQAAMLGTRLRVPTSLMKKAQITSHLMETEKEGFIIFLRSDCLLTGNWLKELLREARRVPRFATLGATLFDADSFESAKKLYDGTTEQKRELTFFDFGRALRRTPREAALISDRPKTSCTLISCTAISELSEEQVGRLLSEEDISQDILKTWENLDLKNYATSAAVAFSGEHPVSNVGPAEMNRVLFRIMRGAYSSQFPPLLYVLHEGIDGSVGGTEKHTRDLVQALKMERRVYVLHRSETSLKLSFYFRDSREDFVFLVAGDKQATFFSWPDLEVTFARILRDFGIGIVHFQHLMGLPLSLLEIARDRCRTIITMNDYFLYCENYDFLNEEGRFCGIQRNSDVCDDCVAKSRRPYRRETVNAGETHRRRTFLETELRRHTLVYPTEGVRKHFHQFYSSLEHSKSVVIPPPVHSTARWERGGSTDTLNIAFLGVFTFKKGANVFRDIVLHLNRVFPDRIRWFVFGKVADGGVAAVLLGQNNVHFHGEYQPYQLAELYGKNAIDLTMILSIWPETYSFTLTEAFACGTPVIATRLGAQGDRVEFHKSGWTIDLSRGPEECEQIVRSIFESQNSYTRRQQSIPKLQPYEEQVSAFRQLYKAPRDNGRLAVPLDQPRAQLYPVEAEA